MPISLSHCAAILAQDGVRHHVDDEEAVIRAVFVTRQYRNLRDERLAIVRLQVPDAGYRCRASIERAFAPGPDVAATCLTLCRFAAETPLVGVEYDADQENLRLVIETVVEDGDLTNLQLLSMVDRLLEAAEAWHAAVNAPRTSATKRRTRGRDAA